MKNTRLLVVVIIWVAVMYGAIGYYTGVWRTNERLPNCQEDEFLFPVDDYKGPGKNDVQDYQCVHIDSIQVDAQGYVVYHD